MCFVLYGYLATSLMMLVAFSYYGPSSRSPDMQRLQKYRQLRCHFVHASCECWD